MEDIFLKNLPRIDLHGFDTETARVATNDFINDNLILKNSKVLIIHGKGTGALRAALWRFFKSDKRIKSYRHGEYGEGDAGVTVVEFKQG